MPKNTFFNLPDAKKRQILEAAVNEFAKAPYQEISINHLIKCMGIPTGSFYQYFEDKKDLYFYILSFYIDRQLDESVRKNIKVDILDGEKHQDITELFPETMEQMKTYRSVFIDNFIKAPLDIKRDWVFEKLIGGKYMALYDYSIFDEEGIDPSIREQKYLMMGIVISVSSILQGFCSSIKDPQEHMRLYHLCLDVLKAGFRNYRSDTPSVSGGSTEPEK